MNINDFPQGVYNHILEMASTLTQSAHATFRQLNKEFNAKTDIALKFSWGNLREFWKTIPNDHTLKSCFAKVDKVSIDYLSLFKNLAKETGIACHTFFSCGEYQIWMQEQDIALCTIWKGVFRGSLWDNFLPSSKASAEEIRKYLKEEKTIRILETIAELDLSNHKWKVLPSEVHLLKKLEVLSFKNNQLTQIIIPKECVALKKLRLEHNQLTQIIIPKECVALEELYLNNNPILISSKTFEKKNLYISLFERKKHQAKSHLGEIYNKIASFHSQYILKNTPLNQFSSLFSRLKKDDKNRIYDLMWKGSGCPSRDSKWDEIHCFDDIILFVCAVQRSIFDKYKALNEVDKCKVEEEISRLVESTDEKAKKAMLKDPFWGKNHALDNFAVLADALFALEEGKL